MDNPTHYDKVVECEHVNSMSLRDVAYTMHQAAYVFRVEGA